MKKFFIIELENGWTVNMECNGRPAGEKDDDKGHAVTKRKFIAQDLAEATAKVTELGAPT